jgi:hypothetical protein
MRPSAPVAATSTQKSTAALVVGELAEDRHRAERDGGCETEEGAGGWHEPHPDSSKLQKRFRFLNSIQ